MIPISTFFVGIHSIFGFALSSIVATERAKNRVWHGSSSNDCKYQPNHSLQNNPSWWQRLIESWTKFTYPTATQYHNPELLQRKIRAHSNFAEYTPQALLMLICLEFLLSQKDGIAATSSTSTSIVWSLGILFTIARFAHAYGVILTYGPSIGRAVGYFGTLIVFLVGGIACIHLSLKNM